MIGMPCFADHDDDVYFFYPHWFGIMGFLPGSDCGDQPQEAFHSHWKTQLQSLTANADCTQILATMQELHRVWDTQCAWASEVPLSMSLPHTDPEHLNGTLLNRLGRLQHCRWR